MSDRRFLIIILCIGLVALAMIIDDAHGQEPQSRVCFERRVGSLCPLASDTSTLRRQKAVARQPRAAARSPTMGTMD